jgi:hypothetical protein
MRNQHIAWFIAAIAITLASGAHPSAAAVIYPWCANYSGRGMGGAQNCGCVWRQSVASAAHVVQTLSISRTRLPHAMVDPYEGDAQTLARELRTNSSE